MRYFIDGMCFTNQSIQLGLHGFSLALTGTTLMDHQGHIFRQIVESVPHVSTLKLPHLYTKISDLASQRHLTAITVCIMANETGDIQQFKQCIDRTCALQNLTLTVRGFAVGQSGAVALADWCHLKQLKTLNLNLEGTTGPGQDQVHSEFAKMRIPHSLISLSLVLDEIIPRVYCVLSKLARVTPQLSHGFSLSLGTGTISNEAVQTLVTGTYGCPYDMHFVGGGNGRSRTMYLGWLRGRYLQIDTSEAQVQNIDAQLQLKLPSNTRKLLWSTDVQMSQNNIAIQNALR